MKKLLYIEENECSKCQYFLEGKYYITLSKDNPKNKYYYNYCQKYEQRIDCNPNEIIPNFCKLDMIYSKYILSSCNDCIFFKNYENEYADEDNFNCFCVCKKYSINIKRCNSYDDICIIRNNFFPEFCKLDNLNE